MTKVIGVRLNEYQIMKLKEISGSAVITDYIRELINKEIDRYNKVKYE